MCGCYGWLLIGALQSDVVTDLRLQGVLVSNATATSEGEVWVKQLADGKRVAALLVNDGDDAVVDITVTWAMLGLAPGAKAVVRDLWAKTDLGAFTGSFVAKAVKPHDHVFITATPSALPKLQAK